MKKYFMFNVVVEDTDLSNKIKAAVKKYCGRWVHVSSEKQRQAYNIIIQKRPHISVRLIDPLTVLLEIPDNITGFKTVRMIEYARALLRLSIGWSNGYLLGAKEALEGLEVHPAYDVFLAAPGLLSFMGLDVNEHIVLLEKLFGGEHKVFCNGVLAGKLIIYDDGCDIKALIDKNRCSCNIGDMPWNINRDVMLRHINVSRRFLESLGRPDRVIVSFSGGKDSLAALDLAVKHYGSSNVEAIYVDTGVNFPTTKTYVERIGEILGVKVHTAYAPVKENLPEKGLPGKINRWCTLLKTKAFKDKLREITDRNEKILVIVGDRDTESEARSRKPPVRRRKWYLEAAPIKQWSTFMVQLYMKIYDLPVNPLYTAGFYRLGCYICPALTSLERKVMLEKLWGQINGLPWINEYFERYCPGTFLKQ